ncbi:MAG: M48 family metallopeptidase [Candidatus Cloacimonetes bacterium]|nr:M48 family metallopeptidase [Candidatus Cloacimonadota bacterium]
MKYNAIRLKLEKQFGDELSSLLQGQIITKILKMAQIEDNENIYKKIFDGHHFKISKELSPRLYNLCQSVLKKLQFSEETDFYISNQPEINAVSIPRLEEDQKHIIAFNSGLIEKLDDAELKFVIGHEIGHLISKNADIWRIIRVVFPDPNSIPFIIKNKINFWQRLSELSADRFGFIASPNLEKVVSSFFVLAAGISIDRIKFNYEEYLKQNAIILEKFANSSFLNSSTHPINPLRLEAMKIFSESNLLERLSFGQDEPDEKLEAKIQNVLGNFVMLSDSELARHRMYYVASAGFILANVDENISEKEYSEIINTLANYTLFPQDILKDVVDSGKVIEIFENSTKELLTRSPSERYGMFNFLIQLALSDNEILNIEIELLFKIGREYFSFNEKEIAQLIAESIHKIFIPKLF